MFLKNSEMWENLLQKYKNSPGEELTAASIDDGDEIDIGVGGRPLIIYVLNLLFESRISDFLISPSKLGNKP